MTATTEIRKLASPAEAAWCAKLMSRSEPWLTLGRTFEQALAKVNDPAAEVYVAVRDGAPVGFLILQVRGPFVGYIQTVAVAPDVRGKGVGTALITFAEERCFREFANVFMCVSSFNPRARELYERLGYATIGEIPDFVTRGHSEILLRKTVAPINEFRPRRPDESE